MIRNMGSIGFDLNRWVKKGLLTFRAARPTLHGLEMHLATTHRAIDEFKPDVVIIDPISSFATGSNDREVKQMLIRLIDFLKGRGITTMLVNLTTTAKALEHTDTQIASLSDTWLLLRDVELNGERNRVLYVLKSRGMAHSNQMREFRLTDHGVALVDVYLGTEGVLTGSARLAREAHDLADQTAENDDHERQRSALEHKRHALEGRVTALRAEFAVDEVAAAAEVERGRLRATRLVVDSAAMARSRQNDNETSLPLAGTGNGRPR
jgi:circadian clock protein KaiC